MLKSKSILLVGDMPGWAFDQIISFVSTALRDFDFYFDYTVYNPRSTSKVSPDISSSEHNTSVYKSLRKKIPFQTVPIIRGIVYRTIQWMNQQGWVDYDADGRKRKVRKDNTYDLIVFLDYYMDKDADFDHVRYQKKIRGIYTDGFPPKGIQLPAEISVNEFVDRYLNDADALVTGSPSIATFYQKHASIPVFFANMAYNEKIFKDNPQPKADTSKFMIGWTGNPNREFKGFHSVIFPAIEKLKKDGYPVELKTQFEGSLESLAGFWQGVDLAVIASNADAGPSMFMEASLCGVPSVSTRIGMPSYVIRDGENGLFCERDVEDLSSKIAYLIDHPELLKSMKARIRKDYIEKLGVEVQVNNWKKLFYEVLNHA